jgi:hypothetical protein
MQQENTDRNKRVNDLLNKITEADSTKENSKMGSFVPPQNPIVQVRQDMEVNRPEADGGIVLPSFIKRFFNNSA